MTYVAKGTPVAVSLGPEGGSQTVVLVDAGGVLPEDVSDAQLKHLTSVGLIELLAEPEPELETPPAERALGALTGAELDALAKAENVDLAGARNKADKVAAIEAARAAAITEQQPEDPDQGSAGDGSDV